ncbi:MAG: helix-turn-helix domain-containing protein [Anaerolineales bacterium]|nr:helix-turn-helix domain-containing protein [Anaerolineales bacterium]
MSADTFGTWIKQRRKKLDLTQEMLATHVGCSLSAIRKIENDERRPSKQIAELLAHHLEVPPEEQTLFLKIARGEGSVQRLDNASTPTEKLVAVSESFSPPSNIPASPFPFIGRQQERGSLANMLTDPRQRLITILGPGGIGKTRLVMEVATAHLSTFDDHVYFIQLAAFNAPDSILPAIASVLNIPSSTSEELKNRLSDYFRDKKVLIVLDNFEHLMEGAPQISELLQKTPLLKILVTSRERLNLQGEWTFELSGLSVPPKSDKGKAVYSALQLFELHIQRMRPDMQLKNSEREAAIRICQLVDGMPLAIELAATWIDVLSCEEIADEIERGFDFLSSTQRDIPERHRSLRAVFEYSWQRLSEREQNVLSGLSVFQGGFRFEAAESVVGVDRSVLLSLVSKSLVRRYPDGRFDLHEIIRQYSVMHLEDEVTLRGRHSNYYLNYLAESAPLIYGADTENRVDELYREFGNLQIAWNHAVQKKHFETLDAAMEGLYFAYDHHGWVQDGTKQAKEFIAALRLESVTRTQQIYLGRALSFAGMIIFRSGNHAESLQCAEEALQILKPLNDTSLMFRALIFCGIVTSVMGDYEYARRCMDEGAILAEKYEHAWYTAMGTFDQGYIAGQVGDLDYAYERMQKGLALWRKIGNTRFVCFALNYLSPIAIRKGLLDDAEEYLKESLAASTAIKDPWGMGTATGRLGVLHLLRGDLPKAKQLLERSLRIFTDLGALWDIGWALTHLGKVAMASEEWDEANETLKRAIKFSLEAHAMPQAIDAALELADCFIQQGKVSVAMEIILPAIGHPSSTDAAKQRAYELRSAFTLDEIKKMNTVETLETILARFVD